MCNNIYEKKDVYEVDFKSSIKTGMQFYYYAVKINWDECRDTKITPKLLLRQKELIENAREIDFKNYKDIEY